MSDNISANNQTLYYKWKMRAEAQFARAGMAILFQRTNDKLLQDLHEHQLELESQNETLRQAHYALEASRDRYIDLYEFAPFVYLTLNSKGVINEINHTGAKLLNDECANLLHRRFSRFVAIQDKVRWERLFLTLIDGTDGNGKAFDMVLTRCDGSTLHAHLNCLRKETKGASPRLCIALLDITQLKQAEANLRIAAIAFESQEGMFITDAATVIIKVNRAFTKITGYSAEEAIGQTPRLLRSGRHDKAFYAAMWDSVNNTGSWQGEIWNRRKNGEIYPESLTITAVYGENGTLTHYVAALTDITQQKAVADQVEYLANHDPLTKLPNRRLLMDRLHQALALSARNKSKGALLFIDLDNFKTINDTLGHDIGDLMLNQIAQRLVTCVREGDTVARLAGDEFVVILEGLSHNPEEAATQAEMAGKKILETLNVPYLLEGHQHYCSSSIGIAMFSEHLATEDELIKRGDLAMYQAKHTGRNNLCFFDQALQAEFITRDALETELQVALEKNQFKLHYQVQVTHEQQIKGAEALLLWEHPTRGLIAPLDFIPLAIEAKLIVPIEKWVLNKACAQLKTWADDPSTCHIQLAINVSICLFKQEDFVEQVIGTIEKFAINPNKLTLELTENLVLDDIDDAILKINALKKFGVCLCMDDFGTGYSSLSYLAQLPFDQVKIDESFIHHIGENAKETIIVQTIIGIAEHLGMKVIAEGVESEGQRAFLQQHGCTMYQGYLFREPLPLHEFGNLLHQR